MTGKKIILGSSSPFCKRVLERAGVAFEVMSADIDEKAIRTDDHRALPLLIAHAKADALLERIEGPATLITADQVVICDGELREKPESDAEAANFLFSYAKHPAETVSAVVVCDVGSGRRSGGIDIAKVQFNPMPAKAVMDYIASGSPFLNAGGFDHEHPLLAPYVFRIEGAPDSVMGLPLMLLGRLVAEVGP